MPDEVEIGQRGSGHEEDEELPCLPVANGSRRDKDKQRHREGQRAKLGPRFHIQLVHGAYFCACPQSLTDDLFAYLDSLGIPHKTVHHRPAFTVEDARALRGEVAGGHTKNLFLRDKKGTLYLVVAPEDAVIELKSLHRALDASGRFSFASADTMREVLGVEPGSVTPFAVINDTGRPGDRVLDADMMAQPVLNFHPLVNTATTTVSREDLVKFLQSTGHVPRIAAVSNPPA